MNSWDGALQILAVLHGCEGSAIPINALSAFRAAVTRAVWSKKTLHDQYSNIVESIG